MHLSNYSRLFIVLLYIILHQHFYLIHRNLKQQIFKLIKSPETPKYQQFQLKISEIEIVKLPKYIERPKLGARVVYKEFTKWIGEWCYRGSPKQIPRSTGVVHYHGSQGAGLLLVHYRSSQIQKSQGQLARDRYTEWTLNRRTNRQHRTFLCSDTSLLGIEKWLLGIEK